MESLPVILQNPRIITEYADLFQRVANEIRDYSRKRKQRDIKKAVEELRDIIGRIDAAYSELLAHLQIMEERGKIQDFQKYLVRAHDITYQTQELGGPMSQIINLDYFSRYPELRDTLYIKTRSEHGSVSDFDGTNETLYENYYAFRNLIEHISNHTRDALNALNDHLETKFD
jgi:hypothetical protein